MIQRSFSSGEVDPALYGRSDVDRWKSALKECVNWIVQPEGGLVVRQGFELKARIPTYVYGDDADTRLISFEYGPSDSYAQVFSTSYGLAAIRDGVLLRGGTKYTSTLNKAVTPMTLTGGISYSYATGDQVKIYTGALAGNTYTVTRVAFDEVSLDGTVATAGSESVTIAQVLSRKIGSGYVDTSVTPNAVTGYVGSMVTGDEICSRGSLLGTIPQASVYTVTVTGPDSFTLDGTTATAGTESLSYFVWSESEQPVAYWPFTPSTSMSSANLVQSGDVQFMSFSDTSPYKLTRDIATSTGTLDKETLAFTEQIIFGVPTTHEVATLSVTSGGGAGTEQLRYVVTASTKDGVESAVVRQSLKASTGIAGTNTYTVTVAAHGLITNDKIMIGASLTDANGVVVYQPGDVIRVVVTGAGAFTIPGSGAVVAAGVPGTLYYYRYIASVGSVLTPSGSAAATVTWSGINGATAYNVYREFGRVYGYIGSTSDTSFVDRGIIPDTKDTPSVGISPFRSNTALYAGNSPTAVGLFQQRLMFGGFTEDTERIVGSHVGNYTAYDVGAEDASGLDFTLAGRTVSGIKHMVEIAGRAVVLSNTSEWVLRGGTGGGLTPTAINARADSYYGCSEVSPAIIGTNLIYLQRGDRIVRDAQYDFAQEALASRDLTLWAKHMFKVGVKRMAYQRSDQILWCLLKDGKLVALTYIPEQNVWGWHRHNIDGKSIHDICVVSEDGQDRLYALVLGVHESLVCRLPLRWESGNVDDHIGFDMALTYDGTLSGTGTLTGGTLWTTAETLTLTASTSNFVVGDVGKVFLLRLGDESVYVTVAAYTSGTVVSVTPNTIVPVALQGVASTSIARCAQTFSGLDHLEGETVGVIADGSREPDEVVTAGAITLDGWFARAQVGIKITADAKTLDLEPDDKDTYLGDFKHVTRVYLRVKDTRGLTVGLDADHLEPFMPQYTEDMLVNANPALQSGPVEVLMDATHEELGSVLMRQDTGLPATILNARPVFNAGELK